MSKSKFFNQFGNRPPSMGEKEFSPSLTLPDMSMTIPELMARYARGLSLTDQGTEKIPSYELTDEEIAIARQDRITQIEYIREKSQAALAARQEQLDRIKEAQQREQQEFEEWKRSRNNKNSDVLPGSAKGDTQTLPISTERETGSSTKNPKQIS